MITLTNWFNGWNSSSFAWVWFIPAAFFTFYSARKMVAYASGIITKTKLGSLFVGGVLVSMSTSIPEMMTEITQGLNNTPATGLSDDIGANAFTTAVIAFSSIIFLKKGVLKHLSLWTKVSIVISLILSLILILVFRLDKDVTIGKQGTFAIGLIPIFFMSAWIATTVAYYFYSKKFHAEEEPELKNIAAFIEKSSKRGVIIGFIVFSGILFIAALTLNVSVNTIQQQYGISHKSAGGILLSMTTASPEVISFIFFVREGRPDAAVGSIIGSHLFNLSLILYGDFAYYHTPILYGPEVEQVWMLAALAACELFLLSIYMFTKNKVRWKYYDIVICSTIVATYIGGWILMLTLT